MNQPVTPSEVFAPVGSAEDLLSNVALGVAGAVGEDVFEAIVRYLATTLQVDFAFVGELAPGHRRLVRSLAVCHDGRISDTLEYDPEDTPCRDVVGLGFNYVGEDVLAHYPDDGMLSQCGFTGYAGYPLFAGDGAPLGVIAVLSRQPLPARARVETVLRIFAARAAAELERLRAEETRRQSELSYRAIFDASEDCIFVHDIDTGAIVDVNPKACRAYGYTREEFLRLTPGELGSGVPPYTLEGAAAWMERARRGEPVRVEWHRRNKDGSLHWDEVIIKRAIIGGVERILAFTHEITERKERERLEAQLRQAQKMEAIGQLTGGIAHDFNNILTSIMGYVVLVMEKLEARGDTGLARYLDNAHQSGQRARDLIQQMLTFSRGQRGEPRPLALAAHVGEAVKLLGASLPASIELETALDPTLPKVMMDPVQLEQILMNLCINARDAMHARGRLRIELSLHERRGATCASCRHAVSGRHVELAVIDDGPGIAPEVMERMFEPFFSTKELGRGSGMGLAMVHGIVHEYGGHVMVEQEAAGGARFSVLLRALQHAPTDAATPVRGRGAPVPAARPPLRGRVLVVDDEAAVGGFMRDLLREWDLDVLLFDSPVAARDHFAREPLGCDLALLDQTMPRLSGLELAQDMLLLRPGLPVILYTGYREALSEERVRAVGARALIRKPVDVPALHALLRELLPAA